MKVYLQKSKDNLQKRRRFTICEAKKAVENSRFVAKDPKSRDFPRDLFSLTGNYEKNEGEETWNLFRK